MKTPGEQRPIDVTTLPPRQDSPPPNQRPRRPRPPRAIRPRRQAWAMPRLPGVWFPNAALSAVGGWLRWPRSRFALLALTAALVVGVVVARSRAQTVDGPALAREGWRASASGMGILR